MIKLKKLLKIYPKDQGDILNYLNKDMKIRSKCLGCNNSNLKDLILEYDIYGILIGLPLNEDLSKNKMCQFITDIAKNIDSYLSRDKKEIPIFFWDESYTSLEAMDTTNNLIKNKKKQKSVLDKYAASVILGDFLREI